VTAPETTKNKVDGNKAERLATILLLLIAAAALAAILWSSRLGRRRELQTGRPAPSGATLATSGAATLPVLGKTLSASDLLTSACANAVAPDCECRLKALDRSFSLASTSLSTELLNGAAADPSCPGSPAFVAMRAEALARAESPEADAAVSEAAARAPNDGHTALAAGYRKLAMGDTRAAVELIDRAAKDGRGAAAQTLKGIVALMTKDTKAAKAAFEEAVSESSEEIEGMYHLAVILAAEGVYNKPRALLLKLLKLRPDHLDARFALGMLTARAGAVPEAKRHLSLLEAAAPTGDERVLQLRASLSAGGAVPAASGTRPSESLELRVRSHARSASGTP
jgi:tetratricopeptide (TPR) repeat protein